MQPRHALLLALPALLLAGPANAASVRAAVPDAQALRMEADAAAAAVDLLSLELGAIEQRRAVLSAQALAAERGAAFLRSAAVLDRAAAKDAKALYGRAVAAAWTRRFEPAPPNLATAALARTSVRAAREAKARLERRAAAVGAPPDPAGLTELTARFASLDDARMTHAGDAAQRRRDAQRAMAAAPPACAGLPMRGKIVRAFSSRSKGIVIESAGAGPVRAPCAATVAYAGTLRNYGRVLILETSNGYSLILAGMQDLTASLGQDVAAGDAIGALSASAKPRARLYFEVQRDGESLDPVRWSQRTASKRTKAAHKLDDEWHFASIAARREW